MIQETNFTGNLQSDGNKIMSLLIEEAKETILGVLQNNSCEVGIVLWIYFALIKYKYNS